MKFIMFLILYLPLLWRSPTYPEAKIIEEIALIVAAECMECDSIEKEMVANVVINRFYDFRFPNTITKVIRQKNQFKGYLAAQYVYDKKSHEAALLAWYNRKYKDIIYFWKGKKPKHVISIIYKQKYHKFGI